MNKTADKVIWQSDCYVPIRIDPPLEFNIPVTPELLRSVRFRRVFTV